MREGRLEVDEITERSSDPGDVRFLDRRDRSGLDLEDPCPRVAEGDLLQEGVRIGGEGVHDPGIQGLTGAAAESPNHRVAATEAGEDGSLGRDPRQAGGLGDRLSP